MHPNLRLILALTSVGAACVGHAAEAPAPPEIPQLGDVSHEDWLTNRRGIEALDDDFVLPPFQPVTASGDGRIGVWGRTYSLGRNGLPTQVDILGEPFFARPMDVELVIDGRAVAFGPTGPKLVKNARARAGYVSSVRSETATVEVSTVVEYDGMVKVDLTVMPKGRIELGGICYRIHYPEANARLLHYIGAPQQFVSQMISQNSYAMALPETTSGRLWAAPFKSLVWLGNLDQGFLWFCASERNWSPQARDARPEAVRIERVTGGIDLVIAPVTRAVTLTEPATFSFGFFATPVRPEPKGWRNWILLQSYRGRAHPRFERPGERVGDLLYVGGEAWLVGFYQRLKDPQSFRETAEIAHADGRLILPYLDPIEMSLGRVRATAKARPGLRLNDLQTIENGSFDSREFAWQPPEIRYMREWMTLPNLVLGYNADKGDRQYRVSPASGWADFLCFLVEKMAEAGADGLGDLDNCYPTFDQNAAHGMGYTDTDGVRHVEYDWFSRRDLMKRLCAVFLRVRGKPPLIIAHASATWSIPFLSFCDVNLTLEHSNTGYFDRSFMCREYHRNSDKIQEALAAGGRDFLYWAFPLERWQAECTGKRFGLPVMILPNLAKSKAMDPAYANSVEATRDLGAMVSVHDNLAWPSHCEPKPILDAWRVRAEFGIGDDGVEFYPYWGRKHVAQCLDPEVYVSAYRNRDKFLVNVANLGLQGRTCAVRFAPEFFTRGQPARVVNAETGEALTLEAGSLALPIPRRDYRMLRVE